MKGGVSEETLMAIIEAYLFETGKAVTTEEVCGFFKGVFSVAEIECILEQMEAKRWEEGRSVIPVCRKGLWALEVKGNRSFFEKINMGREKIEDLREWSEGEKTVLAIIAHDGPVDLDRIEKVMGCECGHWIVSLRERGLVKKKAGKFEVSYFFYGSFGLRDKDELLENYRREKKEEVELEIFYDQFSFTEEIGNFSSFQ